MNKYKTAQIDAKCLSDETELVKSSEYVDFPTFRQDKTRSVQRRALAHGGSHLSLLKIGFMPFWWLKVQLLFFSNISAYKMEYLKVRNQRVQFTDRHKGAWN